MIPYPLAKQLKDAGFTQKETGGDGYAHPAEISGLPPELTGAYAPTLSELIEVCGDEVFRLYCMKGKFATSLEGGVSPSDTYATPEEAVANLWLALNKK